MDNNSQSPVISILMPAYNVEGYLEQTLNYIFEQTYQDFEIIIVNDGSTDNTGALAEQLAAKDSRIRVIHIENAGPANARNVAVSAARGRYITFVDSDDIIFETYLEKLLSNLEKSGADISICSYCDFFEDTAEYVYYTERFDDAVEEFTGKELCARLYDSWNGFFLLLAVPWAKLYKRELFNNISYPKGKYFEDSATTYKLYLKSDKIVYSYLSLYSYRRRDGSIMATKWNRERIKDSIAEHDEKIVLFSLLGIEMKDKLIEDYMSNLSKLCEIALSNGFIDEYRRLLTRLEVLKGKTD